MYLYLLPDSIQKNYPKSVVENNNKQMYSIRLLCSCGLDCWWLPSTMERYCSNSFQGNVRDFHSQPHCNPVNAECGDLFQKTEQNRQVPLMRAEVLPGIRNGSSQTQVQSYNAVGWREINKQDAINPMFIIKLLSQHVSGIIMTIIRRTRP